MPERLRTLSWWYWAATAVLLTWGLIGGERAAFGLVIALGLVQTLHFLAREGSVRAFPVQVRASYLGLLAAALWPPLGWIYWVQFAGTWAMVLLGYCPLARLLSLAPWNRTERLSWALLRRTALTPPAKMQLVHAG